MSSKTPPGTLMELPLIEERYGPALIVSVVFHIVLVVFFVAVPLLMPKPTAIQIGTGPGGGMGGDSYAVGVTDDLGGGAGLFKAPVTPQPPAPPVEKPAKKEVKKEDPDAVALPNTPKKTKKGPETLTKAAKSVPNTTSNQIPDPNAKGAGGAGGPQRGSGGGAGGGIGISIGSGSGGIGDNYYFRAVEGRVGGNWTKPIDQKQRIEIVYSFEVNAYGVISNITLVKSCGNDALDFSAKRAILISNPLTQPPPELRGRPLLFMAQFVYPPDKD